MRPRLTTVRRRPPGQTSRNGRTAMRPYGRRTGSHAARESREGGALFGGGLGVPPQPLSAPHPVKEADGSAGVRDSQRFGGDPPARPPGTGAQPCAPTEEEPAPMRRESPERAEPSLVGAWGYPPTPIRPASRQGSGRTGTAEHMRALGPSPGAAQDDTARVWVGGYPNASGGLRRRG